MSWFGRRWNRAPQTTSPATATRTRLVLEAMEAREVPAALAGNGIAIPLFGTGADTAVEVVNPATGAMMYKSFTGFRGEIAAAAGDVNGDGVADAVVGVQGFGGLVAVVDGKGGELLGAAFLFPGYTGRLSVGTADLNGDGFADILATSGAPGAPVRAIDFHNGLSTAFNAFPGVTGQTSVTGADLNGDGQDEIIVGIGGPGIGGRVAAFDVLGGVVNPGAAVFPGFDGGISLAAGDLDGDGRDDLVIGAGAGSPGGEVKVIGADGSILADFLAFAPSVTAGVTVSVADADRNGRLDIFAGQQGAGYPSVAGFRGTTGQPFAAAGLGFAGSGLAGGAFGTNSQPPTAPVFTPVSIGGSHGGYTTASADPVGAYDHSDPCD